MKKHRRLVGFSKAHGKSWTKVAEPYPGRRCSALAAFVVEGLKPPNRRQRLDLAACAHCNSRVGEARHPGPRHRQPRAANVDNLEDVQRLNQATLAIQQRVQTMFANWLSAELSAQTMMTLHNHPHLQVTVFTDLWQFSVYNWETDVFVSALDCTDADDLPFGDWLIIQGLGVPGSLGNRGAGFAPVTGSQTTSGPNAEFSIELGLDSVGRDSRHRISRCDEDK